ncbi:MAG: DUF4388 domain-containing protein [Nitrospirota bacterium]|nr:DUF4388 domain-containing protein [Nitrospirota bacterium]
MGLNLSGKFSETSFSDVIAVLRQQQATGTLVCAAAGIEKSVMVKKGQIIFAASKDEADRLGEVMVTAGKITRTQLTRALDIHQKSAGLKKIGAIFVENGYVAPKDLFNGLKLQVRRIIQSLFMLNEGTYVFQEILPPDVIPLQIDMEDLLREVIQQLKQK